MIYNDPQNYGPVPANETYPKSMWMPRDGVQRGSIGMGDGDILTPGWPSTGTYETIQLPSIVSLSAANRGLNCTEIRRLCEF